MPLYVCLCERCVYTVFVCMFLSISNVQKYKIVFFTKAFLNFVMTVSKWKKCKCMEFLGIPTYWGSGLSEYKGTRYEMQMLTFDINQYFYKGDMIMVCIDFNCSYS